MAAAGDGGADVVSFAVEEVVSSVEVSFVVAPPQAQSPRARSV